MSRKVKLILVLAIILCSVVIAALSLHLWLGAVISTTINQIGPAITGTSTAVKKVDISLLKGTVTVHELVIGNPEGFQAPHAFSVSLIRVGVDWWSLLSDPIVITDITIADPDVIYEGVLSKSNHSVLLENIKSNTSSTSTADAAHDATLSKQEKGRNIRVNHFALMGGRLRLQIGGQSLTAPLPGIELRDIGKESGGVKATEAVETIASAIGGAIRHTATEVFNTNQGLISEGVSKAIEGVKGLID